MLTSMYSPRMVIYILIALRLFIAVGAFENLSRLLICGAYFHMTISVILSTKFYIATFARKFGFIF